MATAIVTGASGLIGSAACRFLHAKGFEVFGVDNNMRAYFFGADGATDWNARKLKQELGLYRHLCIDVRDEDAVDSLFRRLGKNLDLVVHCAAQPSHDWAAREPKTDFGINAVGTLNLLEACRLHTPQATFIFTSTNKVYGDTPNRLPLVETATRWECNESHRFASHGIDESMSIDHSKHSVFGASKVAADVMCQEYGRYFGLNTGIFRGGCLTGPAHSGAELHGFLAYLVKCQLTGRPYTVFGYKGKQVRDNIHCDDLVRAFWAFHQRPGQGAVYNIGGSRHSNCSMIEAIDKIAAFTGKELNYTLSDEARAGDHIWWISDVRRFQQDYPEWSYQYDVDEILKEIIAAVEERESA
jgi:CDP-paratose 2-epimerase